MKYMTSNEIRNTWLRFFKNHNHHVLESSSLVPVNDPTLLWINAGVAPLKKYFDGSEKPVSNRLTNVQKCIRTNDIENVGLTTRHHTFFEMLGNFSIGDYFKEEAINLAYELLFSKEYFNFPLDKIYITYYTNDLDAKKYWLNLGIKESHLVAMDDNYWEIGEGPSGPNTEIFFDRGIEYDKRGIELIKEDLDNDRFIEIWNIVFSQFNSKEGLKRSEYPELPNKNIDTGAGLERFACILQNSKTNFETDLFMPIINETEKLSGVKYEGQMAFKVIADHIKTLVFAINDGATLSNEGRGYVLRRLLRRALKFGRNINLNKPFLYLLIDSVITTMGGFYKDISKNKEIISKIILSEEEQFLKTLNEGEKHFFDSIKNTNKIDGKTAFKLYDTYGFPIELTLEYAKDNNVLVDIDGFNEELLIQKERSRSAREKVDSMKSQDEAYLNFNEKSIFVGYDIFETNSKVIKIFDNGIVLDKTPFYATSGGQVADLGTINNIEVEDVVKLPNGQNLHVLDTKDFKQGDLVVAKIDINNRSEVMKNHSATHLLHQALKDVLGSHVNQQGSLVNSEYLRFDFNNFENLTNNEILEIEKIVNSKIKEGLNVNISEMKIDDAKKLGAMALFSEKYGDLVRVVNMTYSIELCGGTHVKNTKDINSFAIISVESIGSGTFRVTASTNGNIEPLIKLNLNHQIDELKQINEKLKTLKSNEQFEFSFSNLSYLDILNNKEILTKAKQNLFELEKSLEEKAKNNILKDADSLIPENYSSKEIIKTYDLPNAILKQLSDILFDKMKLETIVLVNISNNEEATIVIKTNGSTHAGKLMKNLMILVNGRGGGRDTSAQGGTKELSKLDDALDKIKEEL